MESRKSFLAVLTLLLAGSLALPNDYAFAKKAKKSSKKSSKKKKDKSKKVVVDVSATSDDVELSEERASTSGTARRGSSSASSSTSSTNTVVDEATEISNLKSNLLGCLSSQCAGDVSYEKCFKTSNIETFLAANGNCQSYLNAASSETVRVLAKQQVVAKIKEYFKQSCEEAGGKISGESCKLAIYYYAKSPDGKHSKKADKTVSVGTTFTCTYANFGLSQQDLEYKPEMSAEDKVQMFQSGIQLFTGLANTAVQGVQAFNASKAAKRAEAAEVDAWYVFDGKTLTLAPNGTCATYTYGKTGAGLGGSEMCSVGVKTSVNGVSACRETKDSCDENTQTFKNKVCSATSGVNCYVYIKEANDIKRAEKTSELIRTIVDLDAMKQEAAFEQRVSDIQYKALDAAYYQGLQETLSGNGTKPACSGEIYYYPSGYCGLKEGDFYIGGSDAAVKCHKLKTSTSASECNYNGQTWACIVPEGNETCRWDGTNKGYYKVEGKSSGDGANRFSNIGDTMGAINGLNTDYKNALTGISSKAQTDYNSTISAYNTNQNALNAKKKEVEELKEQSSSAMQNVISTGTQTLLTGATTLITSKLSADANRESMTGACYLGDPTGGGSILMREGEVKKLNWKAFN